MSTETHRWHYDYTRILWDAGFCFNNHKSLKAFDRNGIDIERIIRERDVGIVEHHIQNILEYSLDSEEARILDPNFVKLFRLSQLAVEYLNYCKKYLDITTDTLKQELQKANEENDELKQDIINYELEVSKLKKKIKDLKSTLHIHQKYNLSGGIHKPVGTFRCNECRKGFLNAEYLKKHFLKRHPDSSEIQNIELNLENSEGNTTPVHTQYKAETDKLQMEIKELKEKLNNNERLFQNKPETVSISEKGKNENQESKTQSEEYYKHVEELHNQFDLLKRQIESEMQLLKSQKFEQDKYEELMEKFFHKLDKRKEIETTEDAAQTNEPSGSKTVEKDAKEKPVQIIIETEKEPEVKQRETTKNKELTISDAQITNISPKKTVVKKMAEIISVSPVKHKPVDVEKLKEEVEKELEEKAKQNIEKMGKQISENIATTFDVLQERLEIFWNKLQEIEVDQKQQQIIIHKSSPKPETTFSKNTEEITKLKDNIIKIHEKVVINSESDDSETESNKNEKITEVIKPQSVLKSIQKNDKMARNLMAELKTKVKERNNSTVVEPRKPPENPKQVVEKPTIQQIYSKSLKTESSSEEETYSETETESESETETPVNLKPSKTTTISSKSPKAMTNVKSSATGVSTLQNRSITSLENVLRANPDILTQLRDDMKDIVASRLKDLGIDPEWTRIPDKTFKQNSEIVAHHRSMAAKNVKSFMEIRSNILENLEEQVMNLKRKDSRDLSTPEHEQRSSRFKSLIQNMKDKAKSIMKPERSPTPTVPIYKLTMFKHHSSPEIKSLETSKEVLLSKSTVVKKPKQIASKMYDTDSDDESIESNQIPVKSKTKSVQPSRKSLRKTKSESSMEVTEFSDPGPEIQEPPSVSNIARSLDSILEMKKELACQLKKSEENIYSVSSVDTMDKDEVIAVSPRQKTDETNDKNYIQKTIEAEKGKLDISSSEIDSDIKEDEKIQKSVLKQMATTSAVKKKVLFDLHSDTNTKTSETNEEQKPVEIKPEKTIKKTTVKSNYLFKTNEWNGSSSSIDSSMLELNKVPKQSNKGKGDTISTKALINVSTKQNKAQDDSDWDISDIN